MSESRNPLFIPLKGEFYDAFNAGTKKHEFRLYGKRWNEQVCTVGRPVILSRGYGRQHRLLGRVVNFERKPVTAFPDGPLRQSIERIFGTRAQEIACIGIQLESRS